MKGNGTKVDGVYLLPVSDEEIAKVYEMIAIAGVKPFIFKRPMQINYWVGGVFNICILIYQSLGL
ncbi:hypothetical protein CFK40_04115 [Virgibacillus necropolis]|uniref:Uncharacterized protein n=1 Tax=Virgibacillus necropolis TaxID=163877 RepID=A0A221M9E4_9BACI|nr:hypothetical protein CFK40_04115 [Virgibacillus necropolis]